MQDLPISILIPTRNEAANLSRHLAALAEWFPKVTEVIAVDSESSDGTREMLESLLAPVPNARVIDQPKGLYQAWNYGIRQARAEFVYVATVGDGLLPGGMEYLLSVARDEQADVVLSPPVMVSESGNGALQWPIHHLVERMQGVDRIELDPLMKLILCYGFLPGQGILGSSASNLYRREFLANHPFPTDQGHGGDTIWGCRYAHQAKMVVTTRPCAEFVFQVRETGYDAPDQRIIYAGVIQEIQEALASMDLQGADASSIQARTFLQGRLETNQFLAESLRVQKQQFDYIGDLKVDLDRRAIAIDQLDAECRRLNTELHAGKRLKSTGWRQRIARWLEPS